MKSEFRRMLEESPDETRRMLSRLRRKSTTLAELRDMLGIKSVSAIHRILKEVGLTGKKLCPTKEELSTLSVSELANKYGVSRARVYKYRSEQRKINAGRTKEGLGASNCSSK